MAVLWSRRIRGTLYEVRSAGHTRRLYTDGVFHSQFNLRHPVTGGIWDLLTVPALFHPPGALQRALVLGVGGGAVLRQLAHFVGPEMVVGVELNPVHLRLARRFFGLERPGIELHQADAVAWLEHYSGPRFDYIVDDLYGEYEGEPRRAVAADAGWFVRLMKRLMPNGILVMNFISRAELRASAWFTRRTPRRVFPTAFELSHPLHENAIAVFLRTPATSRQLRQRLCAIPELDPRRRSTRLRYRIRRLTPPEGE